MELYEDVIPRAAATIMCPGEDEPEDKSQNTEEADWKEKNPGPC